MRSRILRHLSLLSLLPALVAQSTSPPVGPRSSLQVGGIDVGGERPLPVPITEQVVDAGQASLGAWGAGEDYKCTLTAGTFTLIPYLGKDAPHNLPWQWTTTGIALGEDELWRGPMRTDHDATRFTQSRGGVTERWDLRCDAVELSFVIAALPMQPGDLVVRGRIGGPFVAAERPPQAAPLRFVDPDGRAFVDFGGAVAFDATGRSVAVPTAFVGDAIELHVPQAFLATATLPLVIDPLVDVWVLGSGTLDGGPGVTSQDVDRIAASDRMSLVCAEVRWASALDGDLILTRRRDDFGASILLYSALYPTDSVHDCSVAALDTDRSFVAAWSRGPSGGATAITWLKLGADDTGGIVLRNGTPGLPSTHQERAPRLGGHRRVTGSGPTALLVRLRERVDGTGTTEVWGSILDGTAMSVGTPFLIAGSGQLLPADHDRPWVSREVDGAASPWLVAFQTYDALGRWRVQVRMVHSNGTLAAHVFTPDLPPGNPHAMQPRVTGSGSRWLLAYATASSTAWPGQIGDHSGTAVHVQRLQWTGNGAAPAAVHDRQTLLASNQRNLVVGGLAQDYRTDSHWLLAAGPSNAPHSVIRVGYRGRELDRATLPQSVSGTTVQRPAAIGYDDDLQRFVVFYGARNVHNGVATHQLRGGRYEHPELPLPTAYGANCGSWQVGTSDRFRLGSEFAAVSLLGSTPGRLAVCGLSFGTADVPLAQFGVAGGCRLLIDATAPNLLAATFHVTDSLGDARIGIRLPEGLLPVDLYAQWLVEGSSPDELHATRGLLVPIR